MKRATQKDRVRSHLLEHGSISNVEAVRHFAIFRLSERIRELEAEGMIFEKEYVRVDGKRTGEYRYKLVDGLPPKPKKWAYRMELRDGVEVAVPYEVEV